MSGRTEGGVKDRSGEVVRCFLRSTALICIFALLPTPAFAHASDRGHVLLLPTGYYVAGGAFAVAASFLALALLPPDSLDRIWRRRLPLFAFGDGARTIVSLISFAGFAILVAAGLFGSRDPLSNPLPLVIWTLLWVGLALLQGLFGDLWSWLNPWYGPWRVVTRLIGRRGHETQGSRWPRWLGYWPAVVLFFAFAWFELIDPAPDDPARLAWAAGLYWLLSFVAMLVFGYRDWSRRGEFLTVFFSMVARFAVVERDEGGRLSLCWPGAKLLGRGAAAAQRHRFPAAGFVVGLLRRPVENLLLARPVRHQSAGVSGPHRRDGHRHSRPRADVCLACGGLRACDCPRPASCRQQAFLSATPPGCWSGRSCRSRSPIILRII